MRYHSQAAAVSGDPTLLLPANALIYLSKSQDKSGLLQPDACVWVTGTGHPMLGDMLASCVPVCPSIFSPKTCSWVVVASVLC